MSAETPKITALTPAQAAKILAAAGNRRITEAMLRADIDAGAPVNADGTINLIHYTAWLVREQAVRPLDCSAVKDQEGRHANPNSLTVQQPSSLRAGGSHD